MTPLEAIVKFNKDRHLTEYTPSAEYKMLLEELEEYLTAVIDNDKYEQVNALTDIIVVATGALHKMGYDPTKALHETVTEIMSRKGKFNKTTGKWEKDKKQSKDTLYTPDYDKCRY